MPQFLFELSMFSRYKKTEDIMGNQHSSANFSESRPPPPNYKRTSKTSISREAISCDVMISYSHEDKDIANRVKEAIEDSHISVWIDTEGLSKGDQLFDRIGEAITNAKVVLPIISEFQTKSKFCKGEVALASIAEKPMVPCCLGDKRLMLLQMPPGMRLQLAEYTWCDFHDMDKFEESIEELRSRLNEILVAFTMPDYSEHSLPRERNKSKKSTNLDLDFDNQTKFWEDNFGDKEFVKWELLRSVLYDKVKNPPYDSLFLSDFKDLASLLHNELDVPENKNLVRKTVYRGFLEEQNSESFMSSIKYFWSEVLAVNEVFHPDSSLRVKAIEKLSLYPSRRVIDALLSVMENDQNPDSRAVAIITLAKVITRRLTNQMRSSASANDQWPMTTAVSGMGAALKDPDRLVRECACLALGNIAANQTAIKAVTVLVPSDVIMKIVHLWRNDVIASVRECAEVALRQFDDKEAQLAVQMTDILKTEIKKLREH